MPGAFGNAEKASKMGVLFGEFCWEAYKIGFDWERKLILTIRSNSSGLYTIYLVQGF